jgi:predicted Rossmann fold nucleotide-binding protein DprA/Smf involved in DNA uptake
MKKVKNQLKTVQKKLVTLSKQQLQKQLVTASKSLVNLSKQLEKLSMHVDKMQSSGAAAKKKPAVRKKAGVKKPAAAKGATVLGSVFDSIKRSKKGVAIEKIKEKTGYDGRQLSNALYKLTKQGKIKTISRGVYLKK